MTFYFFRYFALNFRMIRQKYLIYALEGSNVIYDNL